MDIDSFKKDTIKEFLDAIKNNDGDLLVYIANDLNKHNVYVAELSEEVVGFIKKHKYIMPEEIYTLVDHQKELYLQNNINAANNIKKIKI